MVGSEKMVIEGGGERVLVVLILASLMMAAVAMADPEEAQLDYDQMHLPNAMNLEPSDLGFYISSISPSSSTPAKAIFILGDSSVDCGENTLLYPFLHRNLSLFPCHGSNSDLIPNFIAENMGLSTIPTFYSQKGSIEALVNGVNFGSAQATILYDPPNPSFQSLNQQLRQVFETTQLLSLHYSPVIANRHIGSSIFYLSFGKEDFIHFFLHDYNSSLPTTLKRQPRAFLHILANQMIRSIRYLYDGGVRKIVVMGILPLGCAPRSVLEWYYEYGGVNGTRGCCIAWLNHMVVEYNKMIEEQILELKFELVDAHVVYCDIYQGIMEIIAKPGPYGFQNERSGCCGQGWHHATSGCASVDMACDEPSSHVWWDMFNPTKEVNSLLAGSAWSGQPFAHLCHPMTVQDLVYA